eukprot:SAG31_NODE_2017_length_6663_cov_3.680530_1_plen_68_part_00
MIYEYHIACGVVEKPTNQVARPIRETDLVHSIAIEHTMASSHPLRRALHPASRLARPNDDANVPNNL